MIPMASTASQFWCFVVVLSNRICFLNDFALPRIIDAHVQVNFLFKSGLRSSILLRGFFPSLRLFYFIFLRWKGRTNPVCMPPIQWRGSVRTASWNLINFRISP